MEQSACCSRNPLSDLPRLALERLKWQKHGERCSKPRRRCASTLVYSLKVGLSEVCRMLRRSFTCLLLASAVCCHADSSLEEVIATVTSLVTKRYGQGFVLTLGEIATLGYVHLYPETSDSIQFRPRAAKKAFQATLLFNCGHWCQAGALPHQ